jgi:Virulence factor BrkB
MTIPLGGTIGWGTLLERTLKEVRDDNCLGLSAQLAYYFFLSVFPALLVVVALTSVFPRDSNSSCGYAGQSNTLTRKASYTEISNLQMFSSPCGTESRYRK